MFGHFLVQVGYEIKEKNWSELKRELAKFVPILIAFVALFFYLTTGILADSTINSETAKNPITGNCVYKTGHDPVRFPWYYQKDACDPAKCSSPEESKFCEKTLQPSRECKSVLKTLCTSSNLNTKDNRFEVPVTCRNPLPEKYEEQNGTFECPAG